MIVAPDLVSNAFFITYDLQNNTVPKNQSCFHIYIHLDNCGSYYIRKWVLYCYIYCLTNCISTLRLPEIVHHHDMFSRVSAIELRYLLYRAQARNIWKQRKRKEHSIPKVRSSIPWWTVTRLRFAVIPAQLQDQQTQIIEQKSWTIWPMTISML